jgi:predicted outer membrane repeat protein
MKIRTALLCAAVLATFQPAAAALRYVSPGGNDASDCSSALAPCKTVGRAATVAVSGDTIRIAGGNYVERVVLSASGSMTLTLQGAWNAAFTSRDVVSNRTSLSGGKTDRAIRITSMGDAQFAVTIDGLTIEKSRAKTPDAEGDVSGGGLIAESFDISVLTLDLVNVTVGGNKSPNDGGGLRIFSADSSSLTATLTGCTVSANKSKGEGGAAEVDVRDFSTLTLNLVETSFTLNKSKEGGGAIDAEADDQGTLTVKAERSLFTRNSAAEGGGALRVYGWDGGQAHLVLENSVFALNKSKQDGGAVQVASRGFSSATLDSMNCTQTSNSAKSLGGGTHLLADPGSAGVSATIVNDILWGNKGTNDLAARGAAGGTVSYLVVGSMSTGFIASAITTADPLLVDGPNGNVHLKPGSPAVDAGTCEGAPGEDFEGTPRPQGAGCDIGADEQ